MEAANANLHGELRPVSVPNGKWTVEVDLWCVGSLEKVYQFSREEVAGISPGQEWGGGEGGVIFTEIGS
jgi:hypothetical protein